MKSSDSIVKSPRLTLPPGGIPNFASLYVVVQFLFSLNGMPISYMVRRYTRKANRCADFQRIDDWRFDLIGADAQLSERQLRSVCPGAWLYSAPLDMSEVASALRGCPRCFQGDFHTPIFQFLFISHCPVHGCPLLDRCPRCQRKRRYDLSLIGGITAFECPCANVPWNLLTSTAERTRWSAEMDSHLLDYLSWIAAVRTTLALSYVAEVTADHPPVLIHSRGSYLERANTACTVLDSSLQIPRGWEGVCPASTFRVILNVDPLRIDVTGIGAGNRHLRHVLELPTGESIESAVVDHSRAIALNSANEFVRSTLARISLYVKTHHINCSHLQQTLQLTVVDRIRDSVCTALAAMELVQRRWGDTHAVEAIVESFALELRDILRSPSRDNAIMAWFAASELACHQLLIDISNIARTAMLIDGEARTKLAELSEGGRTQASPAYSVARSSSPAKTILTCSVIAKANWQDDWARMAFVAEDHAEQVTRDYRIFEQYQRDFLSKLDSAWKRK